MLNSHFKKSVALWASTLVGAIGIHALVASSAFASGFGAGNGGDTAAADFHRKALRFSRVLSESSGGLDASIVQDLQARIIRLQVDVADGESVACEGTRREACNFPDANRVLIARDAWWGMHSRPTRSYQLVIHELLGLAGVPDNGYVLSRELTVQTLNALANANPVSLEGATIAYGCDPEFDAYVSINGRRFPFYARESGRVKRGESSIAIANASANALNDCRERGGIRCVIVETRFRRGRFDARNRSRFMARYFATSVAADLANELE